MPLPASLHPHAQPLPSFKYQLLTNIALSLQVFVSARAVDAPEGEYSRIRMVEKKNKKHKITEQNKAQFTKVELF